MNILYGYYISLPSSLGTEGLSMFKSAACSASSLYENEIQ